ncbi:low-complexity tail membrane protein [Gloeocapsopsis dulcis]|uniref:Low-complexity tail membrane protein n=1 Tax=Gloeocapsopsis dulcis AAB1 = 1H9 TaxID=1433147 RepID=A0A6N8FTU9_9CHRO|nr:low-complexity tail membrane protein [Gloeocapsopsis dulcis]MUL36371.1 hypothetical protein [Gloeocapsopsis dulcis AAB1 = 1H9]WNN88133.1 low-complexity tail membrane protein [Gloeocapsopsis dulcis]
MSFRSEPMLWIHLSGLAVVPICLELCLLGLALGDPIFPVWLEVSLVAAIGVVPVLWMQLQRPFYIFAILAIALKQEKLTTQQCQILSLINTRVNKILALVAAVLLVTVLWQLYQIAPVAALDLFPSKWRVLGLLLAGCSFALGNLFFQIPLSVVRVLVTSDAEFAATKPYSQEKIAPDFTILGLQVNQLIPKFANTHTEN